jgi:hypothetical protein
LTKEGPGGVFRPQNLTCTLNYKTSDPETIGETLNKRGETPDSGGNDGREVKRGTTDEIIDVQINSAFFAPLR